ncbi:ribonuclease T2-like protein, partial [Cadophora sp. MPI-SDFR-AT-0126]
WTIHGLWPDHCDGLYDAHCDLSRQYTNITVILQSYSKTDLLAYMNTYWKDYQSNDENFWEHEWDKHRPCISTLEPSCYNGYTGQEEVVDFFEIAMSLFKGLDSYATLANAGIVPSTMATYTLVKIQAALTAAHGFPVTVACCGSRLDEIWYHFNILGSVPTGIFVPTSPNGSKSDCAESGISYLPKYLPATSTSNGASSTPTGTPYLGKGCLKACAGSANKGCLISAGTSYTTGICPTYTPATSGKSPLRNE